MSDIEQLFMCLLAICMSSLEKSLLPTFGLSCLIYIWNLERWCQWTYLQGSNRYADIENRLVDTEGDGKGGTKWEHSMKTYTLPCVKHNQWEFAIWRRELKLVLCENLEGWDGVGGGKEVQEVARSLQEGCKSMQVHAYLWLIHVNVWLKPKQYFKVIILWLKINRF